MKFSDFKVMTFDVVGTLIDFETGVLQAVRAIGGPKAAAASDDDIFEPYKRGRDKFHGRTSEAMKDVYRHLAAEMGIRNDAESADAFQLALLRLPAFADSAVALRRLRRNYRLVAMTNADRTAFSAYSATLGNPFHDSVTCDDTGCAKPDPAFFAFNKGRQSAFGYQQSEILHVAQSQYHDIGVALAQGYATCWIERRRGQKGFGGTPAVANLAKPHFHFASLKELADAVEAERR
jgi:putative hydrolase of the HAD superfamily